MLDNIHFTRRRLIYAAAALFVIFTPALEGALPPSLCWLFYLVACLTTFYAFAFRSSFAKRVTLVLASFSLALAVTSGALRLTPIVRDVLVQPWPRMPLVNRYVPKLNYQGKRFNDLSRMAGVTAWREENMVRIVTDADGFRNEEQDLSRPLDTIILGDSFGAGAVSQEDTLSSMLTSRFHLNTYNLSAPAIGPWGEYVNLWAEADRLNTGSSTTLVWLLFAGNDLDDPDSLDMNALPWCGPVGAWLNRFRGWRARSPARHLLESLLSPHDARSDVVAKDFLNGRKLLFYNPYIEASRATPDMVLGHPNFPKLRETFIAGKKLADKRGMRLTVAVVPSKEDVYSWVWNDGPAWSTHDGPSSFSLALSSLCAEQDIAFIDLRPQLVEQSRRVYEESGKLLYWYDDTHLNPTGNVVIASIIGREIVR